MFNCCGAIVFEIGSNAGTLIYWYGSNAGEPIIFGLPGTLTLFFFSNGIKAGGYLYGFISIYINKYRQI